MQTIANQRIIDDVIKEKCDKTNLYTQNNLDSIGQAAYNLQSKAGFKLYIYLAKNRSGFNFALSSSDFCAWAGVGLTAFNSAFKELVEKGFLIFNYEEKTRKHYTFYDKSKQIQDETYEIAYEDIKDNDKEKIFRF